MANLFEGVQGKDSIFLDRNALLPHYTPDHLLFRDIQVKEMVTVLGVVLKGQKPSNLFLYGKTGTGKTSASKRVLEDLLLQVSENQMSVARVYLNCRTYNSKYKVMSKVVKQCYPDQDFLGYSATFVYEKILEYVQGKGVQLIVALDEIDMVRDLDELVYALTRANDELENGSITVLGVSNKLTFKERLDPRTKSSLCEHEIVFPPYNAGELTDILRQRTRLAFKENTVEDSALHLAAALAAKESGDARTAVLLLLKAAELAEKSGTNKITDKEVDRAKKSVEEEIVYEMISSLPEQEQRVLEAIAVLAGEKKGVQSLSGEAREEAVLLSGEVFEKYVGTVKKEKIQPVSTRWYREYINELEMAGLISTIMSGKGQRGQTRLIKLAFDPKKILNACQRNTE